MRCRALLLAAAITTVQTMTATAEDFPIQTRLAGGPATYRVGGEPRGFTVELRNTTRSAEHDVHPVIVLVDRERRLTPRNVSLQYRDHATGAWRAVPLDHTENDENVGPVGGEDGPGTTIGAGRSVKVELRLRFGRGTRPGHVTASATVMRRKGSDGEWVGESEPYEFDIVSPGHAEAEAGAQTPAPAPAPAAPATAPAPPPQPGQGPGAGPGTATGTGTAPGTATAPATAPEPEPRPAAPYAPAAVPELAATGAVRRGLALAAIALAATGAALVMMAARRRD